MNPSDGSARVKVAVLGAGLMGHGIAQAFMVTGFDVSIWDPNPEVLAGVDARIAQHLDFLGISSTRKVRTADTVRECIQGCDLVVEAAPEKLQVKRELIRAIDEIDQHCIVATNTSVLRITEIAKGSANPSRIVGTHWWNPPYLMPLVEVVHGEQTAEDTVRLVTAWLQQAGKIPVEVYKDAPGFVGNRMQFALVREAAHIVEQGICSPETVDLVARLTFGRRLAAVGPLKNADFIGLDLTCDIMNYLSESLANDTRAPQLFRDKVEKGELGAKTGSGIYKWTESSRAEAEKTLLQHLLSVQRQEQG
ncbi:MAG: 3-hydroxyacyl-CoA dehydrogenase family protein [Burkholderiaceae bacterium]